MIASIVGVGVGAGRRHEHRAVQRVEVHVRNREQPARRRLARRAAPGPRSPRCRPPRAAGGCRARSRGSDCRGRRSPGAARGPGAVNATTLSTWPSVPSSSAMRVGQPHDAVDAEVRRGACPRSRRGSCCGLRFGLSRQRSVVTSEPAPSTAIDPPSSTIGTSCTGRPRCVGDRAARPPRRRPTATTSRPTR